ncbi:MAG: hypothetical protein IIA40_14595, partial [SAR324 cluster bacterium]|nr:hypothetical protein [SAR324 cluster bacterium]
MASTDVQRKLTAILVSDVVGYSRLMGDDPEGTLTTLTAYRQIFSDKIREYKGRVVNAPGDSLLADFTSVVDAVSCAVDLQREFAERNQELPDHRRMDFRIGVNLGDVLVKDEAIYGDGVNVAARLESLAEPGGICISGDVYNQVKSRLPLHFQDIGQQEVKNIAEPVRAYKVLSQPGAAAHRVVAARRMVSGRWRRGALAALGAIVIAAGGFGGWSYYQARSTEAALAAFKESAAFPLPDKPSIAVLPFDNLSGDPNQEYLSDGITESIITRLAKIPGLFVIARNSSFTYKGKPVKVQQVGRELGVRYVLEGSVQKAGEHLRINAQLIETPTGEHLWAEKYDRDLKDIFAVQDEISVKVANELNVKLVRGEWARSDVQATANLAAYDLFLRAQNLALRYEKEGNVRATRLLQQAIELDADYARAMGLLGWQYLLAARYGWVKDRAQSIRQAEEWADRALAIRPDTHALTLLSRLNSNKGNYEQALALGERAVALEPSNAYVLVTLSWTMNLAGRPEEALPIMRQGIRLYPHPPIFFHNVYGTENFNAGRYDAAIEAFKEGLKSPDKGRQYHRM